MKNGSFIQHFSYITDRTLNSHVRMADIKLLPADGCHLSCAQNGTAKSLSETEPSCCQLWLHLHLTEKFISAQVTLGKKVKHWTTPLRQHYNDTLKRPGRVRQKKKLQKDIFREGARVALTWQRFLVHSSRRPSSTPSQTPLDSPITSEFLTGLAAFYRAQIPPSAAIMEQTFGSAPHRSWEEFQCQLSRS